MLDLVINEEKFNALPDVLKGEYAKNGDGNYHLALDKDQVESTYAKPLKSTNEALRNERNSYRDQLAAEKRRLEDLGLEGDDLKAAVETFRKAKEKELLDKGEVDTLIAQRTEAETKRMRTAHESEKGALTTQVTALTEKLTTLQLDNPVLERCPKYGVHEKAVGDVLDRARKAFAVDNDGNLTPRPLPDGSVPRGKDGKPLQLDEWFSELAVNADHLFKPNTGSGASNPGTSGAASPGAGNLRRSAMTPEQKSAYIDEHGGAAYQKLPW